MRWCLRASVLGLIGCARARGGEVSEVHRSEPVDAALQAVVDAAAPEKAVVAARCEPDPAVAFFVSPETPSAGAPVRIMAVSDRPIDGELTVSGAAEALAKPAPRRGGGPPYFWTAVVAAPPKGRLSATLKQTACNPGEAESVHVVEVGARAVVKRGPPKNALWPTRASWSRFHENVYSAWIEALFDAPDDAQPSWAALHEVLRDPERNFLHDHLSAGEDSTAAPVVRPDCADLPYFLRAYFAFKLALPFGLAECSRGGGGSPPTCKGLSTNEDAPARLRPDAVGTFGSYLRGTLADRAHSGSARTAFDDETSDYYPVPITWESLRPGTVYADPYGHVLVVAKRLPQTKEHGAVLLAVDGQPDGTVARKRFWRGNFLYANDRELGGPGWKRFRPVVRRGGRLERMDDKAIQSLGGYADVSRESGALGIEAFYDRMDDVLAPEPLDPTAAMMETIDALDEQVRTRVKSVENGRKWLATTRAPAPMPEGSEIFETTGPWEDFSTPARDLRLLIAIDVVQGFPARVARRPERYATPRGRQASAVEAELKAVLERELTRRTVTYTRSDGSPFPLSLAEVRARRLTLEVAYNPNECVEARWGATPGSDEYATCHAHAPSEQRARMEQHRGWFAERKRPPRK